MISEGMIHEIDHLEQMYEIENRNDLGIEICGM